MFKDFPNLHPLVVHFPIVLILLSAALQAVLVFKDWPPVRWITLVIMAGGFAGALAVSTVFHAMPVGLSPKTADLFSAHEQYASYALWLSGITLLLGGVGEFFQLHRRAFDVLVLVSALAAAGAVSVAGHHGAQLVYIAGVGPQGHLVMKGDEHGEAQAMPGMEMKADGHDEQGRADDHPEDATPALPGPQSTAEKPSPKAMPSMEMEGPAAPKKGSGHATPDQMGDMDMSGSKPGSQTRPASRAGAMQRTPGMKMPASKSAQAMPKGMNMSTPAKPKQTQEVPGMADMPGMNKPAAGTKKPNKAKSEMGGMPGMDNMAAMPGIKASTPKQPNQAGQMMGKMKDMPGMAKGQAMPSTGSMPGMSTPANPMDKFRFEDNNPARNKPKNAKQ